MKKWISVFIIVSLLMPIFAGALTPSPALGYDNKTAHREFNRAIVDRFIKQSALLPQFEYYTFSLDSVDLKGPVITKSGWWDPTIEERELTAREWIIEGGYTADEPEVPAAYRHFYDPLALNGGKKYLTDINRTLAVFNPEVDAIFWHFYGNDPNGVNEWTWENGKKYMIEALRTADEATRNGLLARAFRCLGEVLHNTADMGCPPHVRNDAHGGYPGVGGSDPYESGFNPAWVDKYAGGGCDPGLKSIFAGANTGIEINKALAEFTNKYFFSQDTVSGIGVKEYSSRNGMKDYPSPKLEKLEYEDESFNYLYTFPSGRKVQLCNDQSVFLGYISRNFRAHPRVTLKNVESQATELVPAIVEAGVNVMRNFFPRFEVTVRFDPQQKELSGEIKHIPTDEYPNTLTYNGPVRFRANNKTLKIEAQASGGKFSVKAPDLKGNEKVVAYISLGGVQVRSPESDTAMVEIPFSAEWSQTTTPGFFTDRYTGEGQCTARYSGPSIVMKLSLTGTIRGPAGTRVDTEDKAKWGSFGATVYCVSNKELEVEAKLAYSFEPSEWVWDADLQCGGQPRPPEGAQFRFAGFRYELTDNRPEETKKIELPNIAAVLFDEKSQEYTIRFKFDPRFHFAGDPITEGLHMRLEPIIFCQSTLTQGPCTQPLWDWFDEQGNVLATQSTAYYMDLDFWQDYWPE